MTRLPVGRVARSLVFAAVTLGGLTACNSSATNTDPPASTIATGVTIPMPATIPNSGVRITQEQASAMARMLLRNHEAGGGRIESSFTYGPAATVRINGEVDWTNGRGDVTIETIRSDGVAVPVQRAVWSDGILYLSVDGLEAALAASGREGVRWVSRPLNPQQAPLDLAVRYLAGLATERAENPLLLRQGDTSFEGDDNVRGVAVQKLRFQKSVYFVAMEDGRVHAVEPTFLSFTGPNRVEIIELAPRTITVPTAPEVVALAEVQQIYENLLNAVS